MKKKYSDLAHMIRLLFFSLFLIPALFSRAQSPVLHKDTISCHEVKVFMDSSLHVVSEDRAVYFAYTLLYGNKDVWMPHHTWHNDKLVLEKSDHRTLNIGQPIPIHGTFTWFTKGYSRKIAVEYFDSGRWSGEAIVFNRKEEPSIVYLYNKKYENKMWSYYFEKWRKGKIEKGSYYWFDCEKGIWQFTCTTGCYVTKDLR